jgi:hypothetical protein
VFSVAFRDVVFLDTRDLWSVAREGTGHRTGWRGGVAEAAVGFHGIPL